MYLCRRTDPLCWHRSLVEDLHLAIRAARPASNTRARAREYGASPGKLARITFARVRRSTRRRRTVRSACITRNAIYVTLPTSVVLPSDENGSRVNGGYSLDRTRRLNTWVDARNASREREKSCNTPDDNFAPMPRSPAPPVASDRQSVVENIEERSERNKYCKEIDSSTDMLRAPKNRDRIPRFARIGVNGDLRQI